MILTFVIEFLVEYGGFMYTGLYIIVGITAFLLIILLLSFLGPEQGGSTFWQKIQKIRAVMDFVSYWFINITAIGSILLGLFTVLYNNLSKNSAAVNTGYVIGTAVLGILIALSVRSIARSQSDGGRCECNGKCAECRIQCRSNPNYYGIQNSRSNESAGSSGS